MLAAVLLATVSASEAGVRFGFGFGLPLPIPTPAVVAPPVVNQAPAVHSHRRRSTLRQRPFTDAPAVAYAAPVVCPPPVVYAPAPSVYFKVALAAGGARRIEVDGVIAGGLAMVAGPYNRGWHR